MTGINSRVFLSLSLFNSKILWLDILIEGNFFPMHTCTLIMFRSFTRKKMFWSTRSPLYFTPKQYLVLSLNFWGKWLTKSTSLCSGVNHNLLKLGNATNTTCKNGKTSSLKSNMQTLKKKAAYKPVKVISLTTWASWKSPADWEIFKLIWSLVYPYNQCTKHSNSTYVKIIHW